MSEIDWKTELKKVEREFDGLPPLLTPEDLGLPRKGTRRAKPGRREVQTTAGAAIRLALVVSLAAAINFWPYPHACGFGLGVFLASQLAVVGGGLWTAIYTWRGRMAKAHVLAMLVILWGLVLLAAQVLPRVEYARTPPGAEPTWRCWGTTP